MSYPDAFHEVAKKVNNWGRWGADDEIGTINLVTDDVVRAAAALVRTGKRFSLALPLSDLEGIQTGLIRGRVNPLRTMVSINTAVFGDPSQFCTSDDVVFMGLQAGTHWDGLGHATYDGRMWNGHPDLEHRRVGRVEVRHPQDPFADQPRRAARRRALRRASTSSRPATRFTATTSTPRASSAR